MLRAMEVRAEWAWGCKIQRVGRSHYTEGQLGHRLNVIRRSQVSFGLSPGTVLVLGLLREENSDRTQP